jgi:hypothetical protein
MGVDASLFAKNAKKRIYFDRLSNINQWFDSVEYGDMWKHLDSIKDKLMNEKIGANSDELLGFLTENRAAWMHVEEDRRYHANWVQALIEFVMDNLGDTFFVIPDNDTDRYWPLCDEYSEVPEGIYPKNPIYIVKDDK